jgi:HK97 family phage portal protein
MVASLPLIVYRWLPGGGKERVPDHPLHDVLHDRPNVWQTAFEFREMMQGHLELRGNAYAEIIPGSRGAIDQLIPLHPDRVQPRRLPETTKIIYKVNREDGTTDELTQDEIFHLRGFSLDGVIGLSPITLEREAIGVGLGAQEYGARFYANDATPGGILEHPGTLDDQAIERLKKSWQDAHTGAGRHKVAVLEGGLKFTRIGLSNADAQFLETRKYQGEDIARIFGVKPHKVGILEHATFSNIQHESIDSVVDTLLPRLRRWEQKIQRDLIIEPNKYFAEFLVDGLLRGDIGSRYKAYAMARQWGLMNANEIREIENQNPFKGGDTYWAPLNMIPAEQLGKQSVAPKGTAAFPPPASKATQAHLRMIVEAAAERVIRKEVAGLRRIAEHAGKSPAAMKAEIERFYSEHARFVSSVLGFNQDRAKEYCEEKARCIIDAADQGLAKFSAEINWLESGGAAVLTAKLRESLPC